MSAIVNVTAPLRPATDVTVCPGNPEYENVTVAILPKVIFPKLATVIVKSCVEYVPPIRLP